MTAWCTQPGPNNSWLVDWIINPLFLNGMIRDMATMEKLLESTDPQLINYTIVRPCGLINGKSTLQLMVYVKKINLNLFFCSNIFFGRAGGQTYYLGHLHLRFSDGIFKKGFSSIDRYTLTMYQ